LFLRFLSVPFSFRLISIVFGLKYFEIFCGPQELGTRVRNQGHGTNQPTWLSWRSEPNQSWFWLSTLVADAATSQHAQAMLAAMRSVLRTAGAASTRSPPSSTSVVDLARLRDAALVPGVLSDVFSFLPIDERINVAGCVSRHWRLALQQPTLWREQGWYLTRYAEDRHALPFPQWLREQLTVVRCSLDWLLYEVPLLRFNTLNLNGNLRHLELFAPVRTTAERDLALRLGGHISFETLRRHLSSLRLQTLLLPIRFKQSLERDLLVALAALGALPSGLSPESPPLLVQWASSLTHLRCEITLDSGDPLFKTFAAIPWPQLRKLQLTMRCLCWSVFPVPPCHANAVTSLARALGSRNTPSLAALEFNLDCRSRSQWAENLPPCPCDNVWQQLLPSVRSLTVLSISIGLLRPPMPMLQFLQLISTEVMPLLERLVWGSGQLGPIGASDHPLMVSLLQRIRSLSSIHAAGGHIRRAPGPVDCFELLHHVHHLPHLRDLRADGAELAVGWDDRGVGGCPVEVADAPQLERLTCAARDVLPLLERWWHQLGRPELQIDNEIIAPFKWEEHLAQRTAAEAATAASVGIPVATRAEAMARQQLPVIRQLKLCASSVRAVRSEYTSAIEFVYLAHLPQLRELDCWIHRWCFDALGSMTQLGSLTLNLADGWANERKQQWSDYLLEQLGRMPLQRLRTLRLEGSDENDATFAYRSARPQDPDFPCQLLSFPHTTIPRSETESHPLPLTRCSLVFCPCCFVCVKGAVC
jgi:hypothetical protein